ncbi:aldo/keto reductase [Streptomyces cyaneofuscatus]|uniref:aldo/keto reductase n=1 Tax=Streptomyces cyaneofuscatus TaxID=66883 RepID=UPI00380B9721
MGHIGLSKINAEDFQRWNEELGIAAVQNVLNIHDRYDPVKELCRGHGVPYVPYRPLAAESTVHRAQRRRLPPLSWDRIRHACTHRGAPPYSYLVGSTT